MIRVSFFIRLTHYHTMMHFDTLKIYSCRNIVRKGEIACNKQFLLLLTIFSTLYGTYFSFQMHFKVSSAICFNLDQSKILLSCNGLNQPTFKDHLLSEITFITSHGWSLNTGYSVNFIIIHLQFSTFSSDIHQQGFFN